MKIYPTLSSVRWINKPHRTRKALLQCEHTSNTHDEMQQNDSLKIWSLKRWKDVGDFPLMWTTIIAWVPGRSSVWGCLKLGLQVPSLAPINSLAFFHVIVVLCLIPLSNSWTSRHLKILVKVFPLKSFWEFYTWILVHHIHPSPSSFSYTPLI